MVTDKIRLLEVTKVKLAKLERSVATQIQRELAALPRKYGFSSVKEFTNAVAAASAGRKGRKAAAKAAPKAKRRKRAVITDKTRAEVKKLVEAGQTGSAIAKALRISLPSVQNIKKALGLVQARK
jgi:DNA-binding NarL/FixJ family response regulator